MTIRGLPIPTVLAAVGLVVTLSAPTAALADTPSQTTPPPTTTTTTTTTPTPTTTTPTTTAPTTTAPTTTTPATPTPITPPIPTTKPKPKPKPKPTPTQKPKPTPKPSPKPKPAPAVRATASVSFAGLFKVDSAPVTVPDRNVVLTGTERPYVSGQKLTLLAFLNGRRFEQTTLRLRRAGVYAGKFAAILRPPSSGSVSVVVKHAANRQMQAFRAAAGFKSLEETAGFGSTGPFVKLIQQRLAALHFYVPQTGVFDAGTGLALDAYHRMLGWGYAQSLDPATTRQLLDGAGSFHVRYPNQGEHAEGDLSKQLLALADGSQVQMILPISSGKPSTPTILGSYQVYLRTPGYLPDGMYYSDFFIRGYAIHGYDPAPDYPASHGCMRLPIPDAITVFNWLKLGDWVDTYYT